MALVAAWGWALLIVILLLAGARHLVPGVGPAARVGAAAGRTPHAGRAVRRASPSPSSSRRTRNLPDLHPQVRLPFGHPVAIAVCVWVGRDFIRRMRRGIPLDAETPEPPFGDAFEAGPRRRRRRRLRDDDPAVRRRAGPCRRSVRLDPAVAADHRSPRSPFAVPRRVPAPLSSDEPPRGARGLTAGQPDRPARRSGGEEPRGARRAAHPPTAGSRARSERTSPTTVLRSSAGTEVGSATRSPFVIIGERINPTGRKKLAEELKQGNYETVAGRRARAGRRPAPACST